MAGGRLLKPADLSTRWVLGGYRGSNGANSRGCVTYEYVCWMLFLALPVADLWCSTRVTVSSKNNVYHGLEIKPVNTLVPRRQFIKGGRGLKYATRATRNCKYSPMGAHDLKQQQSNTTHVQSHFDISKAIGQWGRSTLSEVKSLTTFRLISALNQGCSVTKLTSYDSIGFAVHSLLLLICYLMTM